MPAYVNSTLTFVALLHDHEFAIIAARLGLSAKSDRTRKRPVSTANLVAAEVPIAGNLDAVIDFVRTALAGSHLVVGEHVLQFMNDSASGYSVYHDHATAPHRNWQRSSYLDRLRLNGARRWDLVSNRLTELERELQPLGFRGLDGLMAEYGLGLSDSDMLLIEIAAEPVVRISPKSKILGERVEIEVNVTDRLTTEHVTVTMVDAQSDGRSFRRSLSAKELLWSRVEQDWVGTCTVHLPERTILTCRALYAGSLHDEIELSDLAALPNPRRAIVELADPGLQRLRCPIIAPKNHQEQNDFEAGIAVLLYMLGFESVRVGGLKKLSDAADIFARTPSGRVLVIECTTEVLDPKDKIGKLLRRMEEAKERLSAAISGFKPEYVIGVVAIPKVRSDLGAVWKAANDRGVLILCRPEIEQALDRTRFCPNADGVLNEWLGLRLRALMTDGLTSHIDLQERKL
jgi:hypothetical protein